MAYTRKEMYSRHGIEFDGDRKVKYNGEWIPLFLKEGNNKTGKLVYTFSLPAGTNGTCVCDCEGCYAKTGMYKTPDVITSNKRNQWFVENDIDFLYRAISAQLETLRGKVTEIRIHASGDFHTANSREYAALWRRIVSENPDFLFWTYTKMEEFESLFDGLENGNIVKSVIDGIGINYGHVGYVIDTYWKLRKAGAAVYICRCGIDKNQHCHNCHHCATTEFVLFIEHSTKYVAEKDSRYSELLELIAMQDRENMEGMIA